MIVTDYIVLLALAVCISLWWKRGFEHRSKWLAVSALMVIGVAAWSVVDDRWQAGLALVPASLMLLGLMIGRKRERKGVPWISGIFICLLAGVAFLAIYFFPVNDLPAPDGEYAVGVRDFEVSDASRPGLIAAGPQEPRRLLVRVWYPAGMTDGLQKRAYFTAPEVDTTGTSIGRYFQAPFAFKYLKHVKTNSYVGAPLAAAERPLPVVMYSHGYTSFLGQNTVLMEHLASHGYVVYSVGHTYDSAPLVFPNGDVIDSDPALAEEMKALTVPSNATLQSFTGTSFADRHAGKLESYREALATNHRIAARSAGIWTEDRIFVHDQLQAGAVPESVKEIVAASDFSSTGQMGMSFGGSTTGEVCFLDRRCAAGVNLDGSDFHFTPFANNSPVPFLMFYSDFNIIAAMLTGDPDAQGHGFNDFSYERPETAGLRPDVVRLKVKSVSHLGVSDFTWFVRTPMRNPVFGSINSQDMLRIQNDFVLGFFDKYVRQEERGFPAEQFARHKTWVEQQDMDALREDWLNNHPEDQTVRVVMETSAGDIEVALYPKRAPGPVADFLAYMDAGDYAGASFFAIADRKRGSPFNLVQAAFEASNSPGLDVHDTALQGWQPAPTAPAEIEQSGLINEAGTLFMLNAEPATVSLRLLFNVDDVEPWDSDDAADAMAPAGYTPIGRVLRGLPVLRKIHAMAVEPASANVETGSQYLNQPVLILPMYRQ